MPDAPPDAAVSRFTADAQRLTGGSGGRWCIAVSGGADSLALLLLAAAAFPGRVSAATVDHGLRPAGAAEARHVAHICRRLGVDHHRLTLRVAAGANVQARARAARYGALVDLCTAERLDWLATGHHADDQLETMLMRLNRASGVGGLAGIRARRDRLVRPLLAWRRDDLRAIVSVCGEVAIEDPSNADDRFDRSRIRKSLQHADWLDPAAAVRSAAALADADAALDHYARAAFGEVVRAADDSAAISLAALFAFPREIQRRVVALTVAHLDPVLVPRETALQAVLDALARRRRCMIGDFLFSPQGDLALVGAAPPRLGTARRVPLPLTHECLSSSVKGGFTP